VPEARRARPQALDRPRALSGHWGVSVGASLARCSSHPARCQRGRAREFATRPWGRTRTRPLPGRVLACSVTPDPAVAAPWCQRWHRRGERIPRRAVFGKYTEGVRGSLKRDQVQFVPVNLACLEPYGSYRLSGAYVACSVLRGAAAERLDAHRCSTVGQDRRRDAGAIELKAPLALAAGPSLYPGSTSGTALGATKATPTTSARRQTTRTSDAAGSSPRASWKYRGTGVPPGNMRQAPAGLKFRAVHRTPWASPAKVARPCTTVSARSFARRSFMLVPSISAIHCLSRVTRAYRFSIGASHTIQIVNDDLELPARHLAQGAQLVEQAIFRRLGRLL